jgi:isochorismate synthase
MKGGVSIATQSFTEAEFFRAALNYAFEQGDAAALWRLPLAAEKNLLVTAAPQLLSSVDSLEEYQAGFIFSPFDRTRQRYFLPADFLFSFESGSLKRASHDTDSLPWSIRQTGDTKETTTQYHKNIPINTPPPINYQELVRKGIEHITQGYFEKIVPSRFKTVTLEDSFDPIDAFHKLCDAYPNAMVSLVSIPGVGTWMGATPEILVQVEEQTIFKTVALAGTKPYQAGMDVKDVAWTQKEIEEQAMVCRYIINCFKKIRLREYLEQGPKTHVAGNLMHLKTEYTVDMTATNFPSLGSTMLNLLHPTSAVCGMPLEPAQHFLQTYEGYDRDFYAGYLGPVNIQDTINLFVNLRCMQLNGDTARVFAGAGVTIDSDPQREFDETETKMNTLLNIIR